MAKLPFMKFFVDDWMAEDRLRVCSLAARGLWIDMLCLMHKNDRRGYLQHASGKPLTQEQLARITGAPSEEVSRLLQELESSGVASVCGDGTFYCRRMVKEENLSDIRSNAGKKGGNPVLVNQKVNQNATKESTKPLAMAMGSFSLEGNGGLGEREAAPIPRIDLETSFADFWKAYPRKEAQQRAREVWFGMNINHSLIDKIMAGLAKWHESRQWRTDKVIPHASTWLDGKRWEDDPEQAGNSVNGVRPDHRLDVPEQTMRKINAKTRSSSSQADGEPKPP